MVKIVQLLCPARHCLVATAYEEEAVTFEQACAGLQERFKAAGFNENCGICGSTELHFECGITKFKTLQEAMPFITRTELAQMHTRAVLDRLGMTYDKQRTN